MSPTCSNLTELSKTKLTLNLAKINLAKKTKLSKTKLTLTLTLTLTNKTNSLFLNRFHLYPVLATIISAICRIRHTLDLKTASVIATSLVHSK